MDEKELLLQKVKEETMTLIEGIKKGLVSKEELNDTITKYTELQESVKGYPAQLDALKAGIDTLSKNMELINTEKPAPKTQMSEFRESVIETVKDLKNRGKYNGFIPIQKTLSSMTFLDNVTGQIPQAQREPGFNNVVRQQFTVRNGSNVFGITSNLAEWVEQFNITGTTAAVAEGGAKPMIEWEYRVASKKVEKIANHIKISNEMLSDIDGIMSEINSNLTYLVDLAEETYLFAGTGNTPQIAGIDVYADDLDLAALAATMPDPNNWDCIAAAITQIRVNGKGELRANRIFMNPVDIFLSLFNIKETTGGYVNPVSVIANPNPLALPSIYILGVPVVESDSVAAGTFYVCDMTKFNLRDKEGMVVEMGYENDDFTKNMVTIRGEKRLVSYVKANHTEGFIKDTFAGAKNFLDNGS